MRVSPFIKIWFAGINLSRSCLYLILNAVRRMGLLDNNLNFEKQRAGRIGRLASRIPPSAEVKNKRTKSELSVRNELRFANFGIHIPIFSKSRGRCELVQGRRIRTVKVARKEDERGLKSRPQSAKFVSPRNLIVSKSTTIPSIVSPLVPRSLYVQRLLIAKESKRRWFTGG